MNSEARSESWFSGSWPLRIFLAAIAVMIGAWLLQEFLREVPVMAAAAAGNALPATVLR